MSGAAYRLDPAGVGMVADPAVAMRSGCCDCSIMPSDLCNMPAAPIRELDVRQERRQG